MRANQAAASLVLGRFLAPAARVIETLVARPPLTMRKLVDETRRYRWFASSHVAAA